MFAKLLDGRTIECHYQCDVKGHDPGGINWRLGKGKPALNPGVDLWKQYLGLWEEYFIINPNLLVELRNKLKEYDYILSDCFAVTPINQARAIAEILNKT